MNRFFYLKAIALSLLVIVSCITFYARFISTSPTPYIPEKLEETFDPSFSKIDSPDKFDSVVKHEFVANGYDTAKTLLFIDNLLRNKFYHSYSELSFHDNWIAYLCGRFFWSHFLNPVVPEDIIRYPMAGCSQQGIIFQNELSRLNIKCASIQFYPRKYQKSGHYAVTAYYNNSWHFFDPNLEPVIVDSSMPSIESIIERKLYPMMYTRKVHASFKEYFLNKSFKRVEKEPFHKGNMHYFQVITGFLSRWVWLLFLTLYLVLVFRTRPSLSQVVTT